MMKPDAVISTPVATACGNCGRNEPRLLHHVQHRTVLRRLCTSCVLRLYPQFFCPTCFLVYDRIPSDAVACSKCATASHAHCVGANASTTYVCPLCVNPSVPIFGPKRSRAVDGQTEGKAGYAIDRKAAKILLAAARIASISMSNAAVAAMHEAEKRAKEAVFSRKKAREAMDHLSGLVKNQQEKYKRKGLLAAEVSGSGGYTSAPEKNRIKGRYVNSNMLTLPVAEHNRISNQSGRDRMDSSSEVLAALNAVELKEREKLQGHKAPNAVFESPNEVVPMEVEEDDKTRVNAGGDAAAASIVQNHGSRNENDAPGNLPRLVNHDAQGDKVNKGMPLVATAANQLHHQQNGHGKEDTIGSQRVTQ